MYDEFAEECLRELPELENTNWEECRRRLSRLYFALIQTRLNGSNFDVESQKAIVITCDYLRRLANSMEQYLFNEPVPQNYESMKRIRSYAFIAAEAIDLWCNFTKYTQEDESTDVEMAYARIESALLYLASDYQINAHCSVTEVGDSLFIETYDCNRQDCEIISYLQKVICAFASGNLTNIPEVPIFDYDQSNSVVAARVAVMIRLGNIITSYCKWLVGDEVENNFESELQFLSEQLQPTSILLAGSEFSDLLHLSTLLIHVIRSSKHLSLIHELPRPDMSQEKRVEYENYLSSRASQRPFFWPSAIEYINEAFPGPHADAVVIVPTGSGKSFLAELACSQAMQNGWVLYLAPTNALVRQIQRDLKSAFRMFDELQIKSFVGGQEYTSLAGEQLESPPEMSIAVMTPEKCAMAFRINPNVFVNCRLCIVDEFHTINDEQRGIILDLCLAQILTLNPETRLLLMSAMVSNGEEVAEWLCRLRHGQEVPLVQIPWRPCRTLRSLLIIDRERAEEAFTNAKAQFEELSATRKNVSFDAPLGLLGGLRLQWEEGGTEEDYVSIPLPSTFSGKAKRGTLGMLNGGFNWSGWKNTAGRQLSEKFYICGSNVLCFILTSKHHVFSNAEKCTFNYEISIDRHTRGLFGLASAELGVPSKVEELLRKGIGVHSSALLDSEQAAVERNFANKSIGLLFATPTLAQGLNLPADVVIVAGSSLGDPRQSGNIRGVRSSEATILNAFGRAGRAMVANHGLAILVSDAPFFGPLNEAVGVDAAVRRYRLLSGSDRCLRLSSPIESFVRRLTPDEPLDAYSSEELELVAQLGQEGEQNANVLSHTFGAYLAQKQQVELSLEAAVGRVQDISATLVREYNMPEWLPNAAMKSGIDLLTCWRLWLGVSHTDLSFDEFDITYLENCLAIFIKTMEQMPPKDIRKFLPNNVRAMNTVLDRMLYRIGQDEYAVDWDAPDDWASLWSELSTLIWMYMNGSTYAEIASVYLGLELEAVHERRSVGQDPIPAVFSFVRQLFHNLSIYSGALLAVLEESDILNGTLGEMPLLPLCIRNGCSSRDSLAWFRYGYRNRVAAHEFTRIYPIPVTIQDDAELNRWVTLRRREWLIGDASEAEHEILRCVRAILNS